MVSVSDPGNVSVGPDQHGRGSGDRAKYGSSHGPAYSASISVTRSAHGVMSKPPGLEWTPFLYPPLALALSYA